MSHLVSLRGIRHSPCTIGHTTSAPTLLFSSPPPQCLHPVATTPITTFLVQGIHQGHAQCTGSKESGFLGSVITSTRDIPPLRDTPQYTHDPGHFTHTHVVHVRHTGNNPNLRRGAQFLACDIHRKNHPGHNATTAQPRHHGLGRFRRLHFSQPSEKTTEIDWTLVRVELVDSLELACC